MRFLPPFLIVCLFSSTSFTQTIDLNALRNSTPVHNTYDYFKQNGKIVGNIELPPVGPIKDFHYLLNTSSGGDRATCDCYIQPDTSYYLALLPTDDGSTSEIPIPFNFCLFGTTYNSIYINNNGNISFGLAQSAYSALGFPSDDFVMVAPFFGDVDTRLGNGSVWYKITPTAVYINWEAVGYYNQHGDKLNTFQLIITDGTDPVVPNGNNVGFCYKTMEWTTGDASAGVFGFGGFGAIVGANKGDSIVYNQVGRFSLNNPAYDGPLGNNDGVKWLENNSLYLDVCSYNSTLPVYAGAGVGSSNGNICEPDTITICSLGDSLLLTPAFVGLDSTDSISVAANLNGMGDATVLNTIDGNPGTATVLIVGSSLNLGYNSIEFTATNIITLASSTLTIVVNVDPSNSTYIDPIILGDSIACLTTTLELDSAFIYDTYQWQYQIFDSTLYVDTTGLYIVSVTKNGCSKTASLLVTCVNNPFASIEIPQALNCVDTIVPLDASVSSAPSGYPVYQWITSNGNIVSAPDSAIILVDQGGIYELTVTDSVYGCFDMAIAGVMQDTTLPTALFFTSLSFNTYYFDNQSQYGDYYHWDFGDGDTSTLEDPIHLYDSTGCYIVTLTVTNDCGSSVFIDTVNVNNGCFVNVASIAPHSFNVFPVPFTQSIVIELSSFKSSENFIILDELGRVIISGQLYQQKTNVNVSHLTSGLYTLKIGSAHKRIIKL